MKKSRALELGQITKNAFDRVYLAISNIYKMASGASAMGMTDTSNRLVAIASEIQLAKAELRVADREYTAAICQEGILHAD